MAAARTGAPAVTAAAMIPPAAVETVLRARGASTGEVAEAQTSNSRDDDNPKHDGQIVFEHLLFIKFKTM